MCSQCRNVRLGNLRLLRVTWGAAWMRAQSPVRCGHAVTLYPLPWSVFWTYFACGISNPSGPALLREQGQVLSQMGHLINQEVVVTLDMVASVLHPFEVSMSPHHQNLVPCLGSREDNCTDTNLGYRWVLSPDSLRSALFRSKTLPSPQLHKLPFTEWRN